MYMESKGMNVKAADTGEASQPESSKKVKAADIGEASQPESSKKKKSKKSLDSTKKTSEAEKTKKTKTKPVNMSSDVEAIKKMKSIQGTTGPSGQTKGDTSTAHVPRTGAAPSNNAAPSSLVIDPQSPDCNSIRLVGVGEGGSVNMSTLDDAKKNKNQKEVVVMEMTDDEEEELSSKSRKRKAVAKIERPQGFKPGQSVVGVDQEAKGVKMYLDPNNKTLLKTEFNELRKWFPLKDHLVYASITQLTDPDPTMVYRPCSVRHVAEIQNSMVAPGSSESPQPATVVPYEMYAGKKKCINILKLDDLKAFIKNSGKFMSVLCKLSFMANTLNSTFKFETAFVEHVIHGRNQYKGLGSPPHAKKGMKTSKIYLEFLDRLKVTFNADNVKDFVWLCTASEEVYSTWITMVDLYCQGKLPDGRGYFDSAKLKTRSPMWVVKTHFCVFKSLDSDAKVLKDEQSQAGAGQEEDPEENPELPQFNYEELITGTGQVEMTPAADLLKGYRATRPSRRGTSWRTRPRWRKGSR
ncbi:hypothetical protein R1sor_026758 [Riccia sorocarpa]|uniref:Uncharacterized protein n=1 Tax=Riccia sorocarpa TaxID=122646 RepID=A0ABD3GFM5_9MARC